MSESVEVNQIMARAMKMERFGNNFFSLLAEMVEDDESRGIFILLASEEEHHYELFKEELEHSGEQPLMEDGLEPNDIFIQGVEKLIEEGPTFVLQYAMVVEQNVIDFYSASLNKIKDAKVKKFLSGLIDIEKHHLKILGENLTNLCMKPKSFTNQSYNCLNSGYEIIDLFGKSCITL